MVDEVSVVFASSWIGKCALGNPSTGVSEGTFFNCGYPSHVGLIGLRRGGYVPFSSVFESS